MIDLKQFEVWFVTGSQELYGGNTLRCVTAHSREIAAALNEAVAIPVRAVFKPILKGWWFLERCFARQNFNGLNMYSRCIFYLRGGSSPAIFQTRMQLSAYSDYAIRVLMQTALHRPERTTVAEVAETFGISRNHLVKVVHDLGRHGYLATQRGVGGGFVLARTPEEIRLGDIVRLGEESETVIDCREDGNRMCRLLPVCRLKGVLDEAAAAFFEALDRYTLADLIRRPSRMRAVLGIGGTPATTRSRRRYNGAEFEI